MEVVNQVIAIGSPHGDDQAAWRLVKRLQDRKPINARVVALDDPLQLNDCVDNCDRLIIVDSCTGSGSPGTVTRMEWPDGRIEEHRSQSTHGIGVAQALQLVETLERLPRQVVVFAVEMAECRPGGLMSDVVKDALIELEGKILIELACQPT